VLVPLFWTEISEGVVEFVAKTSLSGVNELSLGSIDRIFPDRVDVIASSWNNFLDRPLSGVGFGLPSSSHNAAELGEEAFGIPTSLPIEKSFLPTAILEETGLLASLIFLVFLSTLAKPVLRFGNFSTIALFLTVLFVNFGEMVFFSTGGGVYVWLWMGLAILWARYDKQERENRYCKGSEIVGEAQLGGR
jgi:hypothetical protein